MSTIPTPSQGVTMVTPPKLGQAYYDNNTGMTMIYGSSGWTAMSSSSISSSSNRTASITSLATTDGRSVTTNEIVDFMEIMKRRMLVIIPDFEKHAQFPALKEAYENYMVLDKLINANHTPDKT